MELDLEFDVALKAASDHLENVDKWGKRRDRALPLYGTRVNTQTAITGQPTVLPLGHPSVGRVWSPRLFTVLGSDDHTVVAGTTWAVYLGDPANFGVGQVAIPGSLGTVPGFYDIGRDVLWIHSEEDAFVVVNGATTGQALTAVMRFNEFEEEYITPSLIP